MNIKRKIAIAASALAAFTSIVLISNQANATDVTPVPSPTVSSQSVPTVTSSVDAPEVGSNAPDGDNVQSGDQGATELDQSGDQGATDGDNVQSGDQTGPDTAGSTDSESNN